MSEQNLEIKREKQEPLILQQEHEQELGQPEAQNQRLEGTYVPTSQRYLKAHTLTGFHLQEDYKTWSLGMLRDALDNADYHVVGRTFQGSRTRKWITKKGKRKEKNGHSELMTPIIQCIDLLTKAQSKRINPDTAEKDVEYLKDIYNAIFRHAFTYCSKRNSIWPEGKARRDMVLLIRDQANEERMRLGNNMKALVDEVRRNPDQNITYGDAVRQIRTNTIRLGEGGVTSITAGGKGTSDLIIVEKNGKKLFIRASESLKKDEIGPAAFFADTCKETEERISELKENGEMGAVIERKSLDEELKIQRIFCDDLKKLPKWQNENSERLILKLGRATPVEMLNLYHDLTKEIANFSVLCPNIHNLFKEAEEEEAFQKYQNRKFVEIPNRQREIAEEIGRLVLKKPLDREAIQRLSQETDELSQEARRLDAEFTNADTAVSRIHRAIQSTKKKLNQREFARKAAKIPDGGNVSNRNVAVSILARALNMQDIVAESEMVEVEINGKKIHGVVMEEAKGGDIVKIARQKRKEGKKPRYSPKVLKDLSRLHLADILWGQIDRKSDNYMTEFTDKEDGTSEASTVKAIDNDMSCGLLDYEEDILNQNSNKRKIKGMRQELPAISSEPDADLILEAVDADLANRLLAMKPTYIDFLMLGILTPPEILAMKKRLVAIQKILRDRINQESMGKEKKTVFMRDEKDWEAFRDHIETNGHEVHSYYLHIYDMKKKK